MHESIEENAMTMAEYFLVGDLDRNRFIGNDRQELGGITMTACPHTMVHFGYLLGMLSWN